MDSTVWFVGETSLEPFDDPDYSADILASINSCLMNVLLDSLAQDFPRSGSIGTPGTKQDVPGAVNN